MLHSDLARYIYKKCKVKDPVLSLKEFQLISEIFLGITARWVHGIPYKFTPRVLHNYLTIWTYLQKNVNKYETSYVS